MNTNKPSNITDLPPSGNGNEALNARNGFQNRVSNAIDPNMEINAIIKKSFPECHTIEDAITQIDEIKKCYESFQPFDNIQLGKLQEAWDTEYTYESNRIEGNTLTLRETSLVINQGIVIGGKSMREHLEAVNHKAAVILMRKMAENKEKINVRTLLKIHALILRTIDDENSGFFRNIRIGILGTHKAFPNPVKVQYLIDELFSEFESEIKSLHPVLGAAKLHHRLVKIHPFSDGNGRTARLMQNLYLLKNGFVVANLKGSDSDKFSYYNSLDLADYNQYENLYKIIFEEEKHALLRYIEILCCNNGDEDSLKGTYFFDKVKNL